MMAQTDANNSNSVPGEIYFKLWKSYHVNSFENINHKMSFFSLSMY